MIAWFKTLFSDDRTQAPPNKEKELAKTMWQISKFRDDKAYSTGDGPKSFFSAGVIAQAKRAVNEYKQTNPEWLAWVAEWEGESKNARNN